MHSWIFGIRLHNLDCHLCRNKWSSNFISFRYTINYIIHWGSSHETIWCLIGSLISLGNIININSKGGAASSFIRASSPRLGNRADNLAINIFSGWSTWKALISTTTDAVIASCIAIVASCHFYTSLCCEISCQDRSILLGRALMNAFQACGIYITIFAPGPLGGPRIVVHSDFIEWLSRCRDTCCSQGLSESAWWAIRETCCACACARI